MSGWQQDSTRLRLALTRLAVIVYYRPLGRLWRKFRR